MNLNNLFEGAVDQLEQRRIEDLEAKMDDLAQRAKEATDPKVVTALRHEFARAKAERDSYHYVREETVDEHGGGGAGPRQWHNYVRAHRADEGWQDFNKVEPYAVCLAGKPVKKFDYYEEARRFHDNWKQKLYREGDMAKAEKITLMPLNLDEEQLNEFLPALAAVGAAIGRGLATTGIRAGYALQGYGDDEVDEAVNQAGALKAAQQAAKFIITNLDDRAALKDYSLHFWSPTKFYQGATRAMRGAGVDEIAKHIVQDRPAEFPKNQNEAANPAQQAAIAIAKKKEQDVDEASMAQAAHNPTGAKFGGYYKGTQVAAPRPGQSFGAESTKNPEPRNFVVKNMKQSGQGKHKDMKRAQKQGDIKHKTQRIPMDESINFMEWTVAQGSRFANFTANPEMYAAAKAAYVAEGMSNALSNITRRIAQPVNANKIIKNREQKKDSIKRRHFAEDEGESELKAGQYYVWTVYFDDGTSKRIKVTKDTFDPKTYYAKQNKVVINVDYSWEPHDE
jgi:hypothetical protein